MTANELLTSLLTAFGEALPGVRFLSAYGAKGGTRRPEGVAVTGEVEGETVKPGGGELRLKFRIFLPESQDAAAAQEIFAEMCRVAGARFPAFSALSRGGYERDKATGLLSLSCVFTFLSDSGGNVGPGVPVTLGGREYLSAGVTTALSFSGEALTSVGEDEPFHVLHGEPLYTVELILPDVSGLEALAGFTAQVGSPPTTYRKCRWKTLSPALGKAVFTSKFRG